MVERLTVSVLENKLDAVRELRCARIEGAVEAIAPCCWPGSGRIEFHVCTGGATAHALLRRTEGPFPRYRFNPDSQPAYASGQTFTTTLHGPRVAPTRASV